MHKAETTTPQQHSDSDPQNDRSPAPSSSQINNSAQTKESRYQPTEQPEISPHLIGRIFDGFRGHKPLEWMTFIFEVLTFFALCVYTYYAAQQFKAMDGQLKEMKSGATDTHALAVAAQEQAQVAETL